MVKRDNVSEAILATMGAITFLLLFTFPGMLFVFFLPAWLGVPIAVACGCCGPWLLFALDRDLYGPRL